jgi:hypothetical protein
MGKEEKKKFFLESHFELVTKGLIKDWLATYNKVVSFRLNFSVRSYDTTSTRTGNAGMTTSGKKKSREPKK